MIIIISVDIGRVNAKQFVLMADKARTWPRHLLLTFLESTDQGPCRLRIAFAIPEGVVAVVWLHHIKYAVCDLTDFYYLN